MRNKLFLSLWLSLVCLNAHAVSDEVSTPKRITSVDIAARVGGKVFSNTHYKLDDRHFSS